jgi:hypothetical protein
LTFVAAVVVRLIISLSASSCEILRSSNLHLIIITHLRKTQIFAFRDAYFPANGFDNTHRFT